MPGKKDATGPNREPREPGADLKGKHSKDKEDDTDGEVLAGKAPDKILQTRRQRISNPRIGSRLHGPLPCAQFTADWARIGRMVSGAMHSFKWDYCCWGGPVVEAVRVAATS